VKGTTDDALSPLDAALRDAVDQVGRDIVAQARERASALARQAQQDAEDLARRAREEGEAAADLVLAREGAALRRDSTAIILDAKAAVLAELRAAVRDAVVGLRTAPDYPELLDGLVQRAISRLGPKAVIVRDPEPLGGIIAEVPGRRIDYTLPALADLALAELGTTFENVLR